MAKLDGKVAIVTGAARGLGRAYAKRLAGLGAKVAVADLNLRSYEESSDAGAISAAPMRGRSRRRRPRRASPAQCPPLFCAVRIANSIPLPRACSRSASKPAGARCGRRPKQRCLPTLPGPSCKL
jgi:NAD(P)-dependent dehydrogenase (short-subunit alcohol dehydrogenase family)